MDEQVIELTTSFLNGNRNDVCRTVLADTNAPQLAALITRKLCKMGGFQDLMFSFDYSKVILKNSAKFT